MCDERLRYEHVTYSAGPMGRQPSLITSTRKELGYYEKSTLLTVKVKIDN